MTKEQAVERIRKLRAVAASTNHAGERESAEALAGKLMAKYGVTELDLAPSGFSFGDLRRAWEQQAQEYARRQQEQAARSRANVDNFRRAAEAYAAAQAQARERERAARKQYAHAGTRTGRRSSSQNSNTRKRNTTQQSARPKPGTKTRRVWDICDREWIYGTGPIPSWFRDDVMKACKAEGINPATASTQYYRWKTYHF